MQTLLAGYASDDKEDIKEAEKEDDYGIEDEGDHKGGLKVIVEDSDMAKEGGAMNFQRKSVTP